MLLVLAALTSMDLFLFETYTKEEAKHVQLELCDKIAGIDAEVGVLAKAVVENGVRTLPIIINSNSTDINQAFLAAIKEALERADLDYLLPKTYFDSAVEILDKWKTSYPDVIRQLTKELKKYKQSFESLYIGLKQFDQKAYLKFCEIYPAVAVGTTFNPLTNMDVVKLYMAVVEALCEQTVYTGINIIFDEFSKFLEANLDASKMLNFKIIQDMAEVATRSGHHQIHFTCITHKDILDYSSSDSFKTVEGRFNKIQYVSSSEQSYELIANAIPKKAAFDKLVEDYPLQFIKAAKAAAVVNVFSEIPTESYEKNVVKGCFPLAPLSTFSLFHISGLVGQNERTLFTFLAKDDEYSLPKFLVTERAGIEFVTIDLIYDYFQELFKKEIFNQAVHSVWAKTDSALRQVTNLNQRKILKAIAVITMIQDERLKPIPSHIKVALMMEDEDFSESVYELLKRHILSQRDSAEYVLLTANGVDVQKNVENFVNSKVSRINKSDILESDFSLGYIMPREYNDRFGMIRYFKRIYLEARTLLSYKTGEQLLKDFPYDGVVAYILAVDEQERDSVLDHISSFTTTPEVVICVTEYQYDVENLLKKIVAIKQLKKTDLANDPHNFEEIQIYEDDICKQVNSAIDMMFSPSSLYSQYFNSQGQLDVFRQVDLNKEITKICMFRYSKTPVINNEMVNKSVLHSQNITGRNIAVDWVLQHAEDTTIPCIVEGKSEVSIFKAMYSFTGLAESEHVQDNGINEVMEIIKDFVNSCEEEARTFEPLYEILRKPPYGMRKGVIPLFIVYVLRKVKDNVVLYFKEKEIELTASALSALNDAPSDYSLLLEQGTREREEFLYYLQELFAPYEDRSYTGTNRIFSVVKSMQTWMRSLPEYTKKYTIYYNNGVSTCVDPSTKVVRNDLLKFELNCREVLFDSWKTKLSASGSLPECASEIKRIKDLLDNHLIEFKKSMINYLITLFVPGYTGSLSKAIRIWIDKLPESTKHHIFDTDANALLDLAENWTSYDDQRLLDELGMMLVSLAIEDWTDQLAEQFQVSIERVLDTINNYVDTQTDKEDCILSIYLPGMKVERTFSESGISLLGNTALNNLKAVFDEYNGAISPNEQLAIIAKLISEIIQ